MGMTPLIANESLVRKILYQLEPRDRTATCATICEGLTCTDVQSEESNLMLFIIGSLRFLSLSQGSQFSIENYLKIVLGSKRDKVLSLQDGNFSEYRISHNQYIC